MTCSVHIAQNLLMWYTPLELFTRLFTASLTIHLAFFEEGLCLTYILEYIHIHHSNSLSFWQLPSLSPFSPLFEQPIRVASCTEWSFVATKVAFSTTHRQVFPIQIYFVSYTTAISFLNLQKYNINHQRHCFIVAHMTFFFTTSESLYL